MSITLENKTSLNKGVYFSTFKKVISQLSKEDDRMENITDLYNIIIKQVEEPLLNIVMEHSRYNKSKATGILGISCGTLRTKLKNNFDNKY